MAEIAAVTDIGAVAQAAAAAFKAFDDLVLAFNTPAMIQGRKNVEIQKAYDQIVANANTALATGDVTKIELDLTK